VHDVISTLLTASIGARALHELLRAVTAARMPA
jgi:hypothetical protein